MLMQQLTSEDLTELIAADAVGLVPDAWEQTGQVASMIANTIPGIDRTFTPRDFIPGMQPRTTNTVETFLQREKNAR